jgi:hypothetical protein
MLLKDEPENLNSRTSAPLSILSPFSRLYEKKFESKDESLAATPRKLKEIQKCKKAFPRSIVVEGPNL